MKRPRAHTAAPASGLTALRVLLAPLTSWRAYRLMRAAPDDALDFDTAWRRARLLRHPDEIGYLQAGHGLPSRPALPDSSPHDATDKEHRHH